MYYLLHNKHSAQSRALHDALVSDPNATVIDWYSETEEVARLKSDYLAKHIYPSAFPVLVDDATGAIVNEATSLQDLTNAVAAQPAVVTVERPSDQPAIIVADGVDSVIVRYRKVGATSIDVTKNVTVIATGAVTTSTVSVALDANGEGAVVVTSTEAGVLIELVYESNTVSIKAV